MTYNAFVRDNQGLSQIPVDILEIAEELPTEVSPPDEVSAFRSRYLNKADQTRLMWAIITLWEGKNTAHPQMSALDAFYWLKACGFVKARQTPKQPALWMETFVAREKAKAEGNDDPELPVAVLSQDRSAA